MRMLRLTNDQYDVLYDLLEDTISDISDKLEDDDLTLDDYEIYKVWKKLKKMNGES